MGEVLYWSVRRTDAKVIQQITTEDQQCETYAMFN